MPAAKQPWRKVLYERQDYPDNYVDPSVFLSALRCDPSGSRPTPVQCFLAAGHLTQEVSLSCLCVCLFVWLDAGDDNRHALLLPAVLGLSAALALAVLALAVRDTKSARRLLGNTCVFLLFGFGFSPVLKDLTSTISTDTIYAMVTLAGLVHLFVQDYGAQAPLVSSTLAFNASLFAAVCLASRLKSILQAFTLLTFCASVFAGSPLLHRVSMRGSQLFQTCLTVSLCLAALAWVSLLWGPHWRTPCTLLLALVAFLNFLCPWVFLRLQGCKENISGPWDEAVVQSHHDTTPEHRVPSPPPPPPAVEEREAPVSRRTLRTRRSKKTS